MCVNSEKDLEPFVKAMYRILEPFQQHDPINVVHIQGNTESVKSIDRHFHTVTVPDPSDFQ